MSQNKYALIGGDGKEYGPFTLKELKDYLNQGRANLQSQVREAGSEETWQPLGQLLNQDSREKMNRLTKDLVASDRWLDTRLAFRQGMELFSAHMGMLIGACLLYFIILTVVGVIGMVVPFAQILVQGPLTGGLYILTLNLIRNNSAEIADLFEGFKRNFLWLLLINLVQGLIIFGACIPGLVLLAAGGFSAASAADQGEGIGVAAVILFSAGGLLVLILGLVALVLTCFPLILAADKRLNLSEAFSLGWRVSKRNFGPLLILFLLGGTVLVIASIPCGLGLIFAFPWFLAVVTQAYSQLFALHSAAASESE